MDPRGSYPSTGQYPAALPPNGMNPEEEGVSLRDVLATFWQHKAGILLILLFAVGGSLAWTLTRSPEYVSDARVLLEKSSPSGGLLGELSLLTSAPPAAAEIEVVRSREIARKIVVPPADETAKEQKDFGLGLVLVVDDLDRYSPLQLFLRKFRGQLPKGRLRAELVGDTSGIRDGSALLHFLSRTEFEISQDNPSRSERRLGVLRPGEPVAYGGIRFLLHPEGDLSGRSFRLRWLSVRSATESLLSRLSVTETARGSGVLRLVFSDSDPERAARVVNQVVRAYIQSNRERLALRARTTVSYIESQIERIRKDLEDAESELVHFQESSGSALLTDSARAVVDRMSDLDLERARLALLIESQNHLVESLDSGLSAESAAAGAELDPQTASLLQELADLLIQSSSMEEEYTADWPPLIQLRAQIKDLRQRIRANIRARADSLQHKDKILQTALDRWQGELDRLPATERDLARFQRKAQSFEQIYTYLLQQEQQARIAENSAIASVTVVDWGVPAVQRSRPVLSLNLAIALMLGLFLGGAFALWRGPGVRTILSAAQLESSTGLPQFGIIPDFSRGGLRVKGLKRGQHFLALRDDPNGSVAESYRALRAHIRFAATGRELKTLTITSAAQGEGKSITIADLAIALAGGGSRVLLVDADMRRPVVHKLASCPQSPGLAEILRCTSTWQDCVAEETNIPGLSVIPAGDVKSTNPGDLLALEGMSRLITDLREAFDFVLFDVPPVLAVADASSLLNHLDGILLLVRYDMVPEPVVVAAARRLTLVGAPLIGAVLNGVLAPRSKRHSYGYGYGYGYSYGYGYGRDKNRSE